MKNILQILSILIILTIINRTSYTQISKVYSAWTSNLDDHPEFTASSVGHLIIKKQLTVWGGVCKTDVTSGNQRTITCQAGSGWCAQSDGHRIKSTCPGGGGEWMVGPGFPTYTDGFDEEGNLLENEGIIFIEESGQ